MRTPVFLVAGQGDTHGVVGEMRRRAGTVVVEHRFDGHVVKRRITTCRHGKLNALEEVLELAKGCVACTIRNDLLILLRKLHRRTGVERVVVHLDHWLEPEPICWAINHVCVALGSGFVDGPAARDVEIAAVITCIDTAVWLRQALGAEELPDGRTEAQVVVSQAEFADLVVCPQISQELGEILVRLNPRARIVLDVDAVEVALKGLAKTARRGRSDDPHGPLLEGQPPLESAGAVALVEFQARRPFHPERLHDALDVLLDGVIRARGRMWLASNARHAMWLESAGGGLRVSSAGLWLAAMVDGAWTHIDPQRRAIASALWDERHGDRHTSLTVLACGAHTQAIRDGLEGALLTDEEMLHTEQWADLEDPFGDWHEDPCSATIELQSVTGEINDEDHR